MSTDEEWEKWGARDPYFGVLTDPRFRASKMTADDRSEFFLSGRMHASYVMNTCRHHIDASFAPASVMDFGCGVGRVLIPLAIGARRAVGVDISTSMLAEARRNCDAQQAGHVELVLSDDMLSAVHGDFDLVHSCIVLQHIDVPRGRELFRQLVSRVRPGGIGALHVTYAWDLYGSNFGQPQPAPPDETPPASALAQAKSQVRRLLQPLRISPPSIPAPKPAVSDDPEMQMNYYNLSELAFILQQAGAGGLHVDLTDHGGAMGAFFFFRRSSAP